MAEPLVFTRYIDTHWLPTKRRHFKRPASRYARKIVGKMGAYLRRAYMMVNKRGVKIGLWKFEIHAFPKVMYQIECEWDKMGIRWAATEKEKAS